MNIDNGDIRPWDSLTAEEKESGRWVKLSEGEFALAERIEAVNRRKRLTDIFGPPSQFEPDTGFTMPEVSNFAMPDAPPPDTPAPDFGDVGGGGSSSSPDFGGGGAFGGGGGGDSW